MTDTITMPREVAKRILRNIEIGNKLSAGIEMRREIEAALEQPQGEPPGSTESAYQRGYLDGMAKGRRDAALDAAEQQPVAWLLRDANNHKVWFLEKTSTPTGYRGEWIKTPLYTRPQPQREPLTDAQINGHRLALPYDGEDLPDPWDFKQGVKAAERAHRIGGEA